jgi:hypothetical protein
MTPDELPADMEGRLDHALNKAGRLMHEMNFVGTPNWQLSFDDLRALLKAYQERGRALEAIQTALETKLIEAKIDCDGSEVSVAYADGVIDTYNFIRAALNQKGDER